MSLPTLAVPEETVTLYSRNTPVRIRPYLVGEEKILLMAQQAQEQDANTKEVENAVRQIIKRCTFGDVDVTALPMFDVEWLFLQLRAKSVSNLIAANFRCVNDVNGKPCNTVVPVNIDINTIQMTVPDGHTNRIWLDDTTGILLKYPTMPDVNGDIVDAICACLEAVFLKSGEVFEIKDHSPDDIRAFVEQMSIPQCDRVRATFFDTMPRLAYTFTFTCPQCQHSEEVTLRGLASFFD